MDTQNLTALRDTIQLAKTQERDTQQLTHRLQHLAPTLHGSIHLPANREAVALFEFVTRYIDLVPMFMEAIIDVTRQANISDYTDTFLKIAEDFFVNPPESLEANSGMIALLGKAYLAHRLMEEINDRFLGKAGIPLAPMDMTRANLIVHSVLGESYANELDMAVQFALELCIEKEKIFESQQFQEYAKQRESQGWSKELDEWPCLTEDLAITLEFGHLDDHTDGSHNPIH